MSLKSKLEGDGVLSLEKQLSSHQFFSLINTIITKIENIRAPALLWVVSFYSMTLVRDFLENFIETHDAMLDWQRRVEFTLFWVVVFLPMSMALSLINKRPVAKVSRAVVILWPVTMLAPVLDALLYKGHFFSMGYVYDKTFLNYISYFSFCPFGLEATYGIRIEIALAILGAVFYTQAISGNILKSLLAGWAVYTICFVAMAIPGIAQDIGRLFFYKNYFCEYPTHVLVIVLVLAVLYALFYMAMLGREKLKYFVSQARSLISFRDFQCNFNVLKALIKNLRPSKTIYYNILFLGGVLLGIHHAHGNVVSAQLLIRVILGSLSLIFAVGFVTGVNDIYDVKMDKNRPLINEMIPLNSYKIYVALFFALSLLCTSCVSQYTANIVLYFMAAHSFIYSAPPLRLKKLFLIPHLLIGLCSLLAVLLGLSLLGDMNTFEIMNKHTAFFIFIAFSLIAVIKDLATGHSLEYRACR